MVSKPQRQTLYLFSVILIGVCELVSTLYVCDSTHIANDPFSRDRKVRSVWIRNGSTGSGRELSVTTKISTQGVWQWNDRVVVLEFVMPNDTSSELFLTDSAKLTLPCPLIDIDLTLRLCRTRDPDLWPCARSELRSHLMKLDKVDNRTRLNWYTTHVKTKTTNSTHMQKTRLSLERRSERSEHFFETSQLKGAGAFGVASQIRMEATSKYRDSTPKTQPVRQFVFTNNSSSVDASSEELGMFTLPFRRPERVWSLTLAACLGGGDNLVQVDVTPLVERWLAISALQTSVQQRTSMTVVVQHAATAAAADTDADGSGGKGGGRGGAGGSGAGGGAAGAGAGGSGDGGGGRVAAPDAADHHQVFNWTGRAGQLNLALTYTLSDCCQVERNLCTAHSCQLAALCRFLPHCASVCGLQCSFEPDAGACSWDWRPRDDTVRLVTGREAVATLMSRQPGDMTAAIVDADNNTDGHYLLMFDWGREVNARLLSPWFLESGDNCRLQMRVHYFSSDLSYIALVVNKTSTPDNPIFVTGKYSGRKINTWDSFTEKIGKIGEPFQLTVEVKVMAGRPRNHVAIDNIQLIDCGKGAVPPTAPEVTVSCSGTNFRCEGGVCVSVDKVCDIRADCLHGDDEIQQCDLVPVGGRCDFENGSCGWLSDRGQLRWRLHQGRSVSDYTGPDRDNTLQTAEGSYMFLDIRGGDFAYYAVLKSPWFPPMPDYNQDMESPYYQSCKLRFYVHLYGSHIGELAVYIVDSVNGRSVVWRHFGTRSNSWEKVTVALPTRYNSSYHLEFQGARSFGDKGDMGLDDLTLSPECFALRVPRQLAQQYKYDLNNATSWEVNRPSMREPNGSVYSFGTCGTAGPRGPQASVCARAYAGTNVKVEVLHQEKFKGFQVWTVPASGIYSIIAAGASGGAGFDSSSGNSKATEAVSVVKLQQGEKIYMVVGQQGANACNENASRFYRESCQSRYTALTAPHSIGSVYMGPTEAPSSTQSYHTALRQIIDSARASDQWRHYTAESPTNSYSGRRPSGSTRWPNDALSRLRHTRSLDSEEPINMLQKIQFIGGGGGGGGGTFVFKMFDGLPLPLVVAGGSGGLADDLSDLVSPHGRGENRTAEPSAGHNIYPDRAGPGGGWGGVYLTHSAGKSLLEGAEGGAPCPNASRWHTYGGFGGGGGGCSAGGGGGGYTGGDAYRGAQQNGQGGWSFSSGLYRVIREASHFGPGHVFIIPSFKGCGCQHLCVAVDRYILSSRCVCQDGWYLMSDNVSCQGPDRLSSTVHWTDIVMVVLAALAAAFFIVLSSLTVCYYSTYRREKALARHRELDALQLNRLRNSSGDILTEYNPNYEFGGTLPSSVKELKEIPRENLTLVRQLGQGAFGMVHQGYMRSSASDSVEMTVAVKTLAELSAPQAELDFIMEAVIMSRFDHPNIVHFIGVSFSRHPRYIVLELLSGGDLKSFLREIRPTKDRASSMTMHDLLTGAIDVAKGLEYLETKRFIHRDIATRNCLLTTKGPGRVVKIADFGMSKDIYRADYYRKGGRTMIPVKWMPPEAFLDGIFTSKTDVWSFGVLLWEIMSLGLLPYPGRGNTEVMQLVMEGHRLPRPPSCPPPLHELMLLCWSQHPDDRPVFSSILDRLDQCIKDAEVLSCSLPVFDDTGLMDANGSATLDCVTDAAQPPPQSPDDCGPYSRHFSSTDYLLPSVESRPTIAASTVEREGSSNQC